MLLMKERKLIVEYGKKLVTNGLTKGTGGNLSICNRKDRLIAISPSGMDYFETSPEDIVIMDFDGTVIEGKRRPSVEHGMHLAFYAGRSDINGMVHTHSAAACAASAFRRPLPAVSYLVALCGLSALPCAEYAVFGTERFAESALKAVGTGYAALLANHGMVSVGNDLARAFYIAEEMEFCCEIYLKAKAAGEPICLGEEEMLELKGSLLSYGTKPPLKDLEKGSKKDF